MKTDVQDYSRRYRARLKDEFAQRCGRNSRYSLRAFARDAGVLPSRLSDILGGKQGMSREVASGIAARLGWSAAECEEFATLVEAAHARSRLKKETASRLLNAEIDPSRTQVDETVFAIVSDWYHFAILELTCLDGFTLSPANAAKRLSITVIEAERAIDRLTEVGLLQKTATGWKATYEFPSTESAIPSASIRQCHAQLLDKAKHALYFQDIAERDVSAIQFAVCPEDIPRLKKEIREFRRSVERRYKARPGKRRVYAMSVQLFALSEDDQGAK